MTTQVRLHVGGDVSAMPVPKLLKFSKAEENGKLRETEAALKELGFIPEDVKMVFYSFSLPSGHTCPGALLCKAKADRVTGKITDGKLAKYRCFSATQEAAFPTVRNQRWYNFDILREIKDEEEMAYVIYSSVPKDATVNRIHVGGDFFNQTYFNAWVIVATMLPHVFFYAYTKSVPFWQNSRYPIPDNLVFTGSDGGRHDALLAELDLKMASVVFSEEEAQEKGLSIDHDETHAITGSGQDNNFGLLLHGIQPKGTDASVAMKAMRDKGVRNSYSHKKQKEVIGA